MSKISNKIAFVPDTEINGQDYLVGTDIDNALRTASFRIADLGSHFNMVNGSRNFEYDFYQRTGINFAPLDGGFYSNDNNQNPDNITYFIVSKTNANNKDVSSFFNGITTTNPFDLILSQKTGLNSIFFFSITSVQLINDYYKLIVSKVFSVAGNSLDFKTSNLAFNLKPNTVGVHNNLSGLNAGDYKHLTATEKTYFDALPTALNLKADKNVTQIRVNASITIDASWNGAIVIITAPSVVLTVPADLPVIRFKIVTRPTATCDFTLTTPKVWVNGTPTLIPEKSESEFLVDNLNSNEVYVSKPNATQASGLEIIDPIPSIEVQGWTDTLIKEYDLGILTGKKMIEFYFLFHKSVNASETLNPSVRLYDTIDNIDYIVAFNSSNGNTISNGISRFCGLNADKLRVANSGTPSLSDFNYFNDPITEYTINPANNFKLRVYMFNSNNVAKTRQYFGKINLK